MYAYTLKPSISLSSVPCYIYIYLQYIYHVLLLSINWNLCNILLLNYEKKQNFLCNYFVFQCSFDALKTFIPYEPRPDRLYIQSRDQFPSRAWTEVARLLFALCFISSFPVTYVKTCRRKIFLYISALTNCSEFIRRHLRTFLHHRCVCVHVSSIAPWRTEKEVSLLCSVICWRLLLTLAAQMVLLFAAWSQGRRPHEEHPGRSARVAPETPAFAAQVEISCPQKPSLPSSWKTQQKRLSPGDSGGKALFLASPLNPSYDLHEGQIMQLEKPHVDLYVCVVPSKQAKDLCRTACNTVRDGETSSLMSDVALRASNMCEWVVFYCRIKEHNVSFIHHSFPISNVVTWPARSICLSAQSMCIWNWC